MDDFERWFGATRRVREPWQALEEELEEVAPKTFVLAHDRAELNRRRSSASSLRLFPAFDPFVLHPLGGRSVDEQFSDRVYRKAAWVSATVIEGGRVVGVWKHGCRGKKIAVTVEPFRPIPASTRTAIEREARALARYLGGEPELEIVG